MSESFYLLQDDIHSNEGLVREHDGKTYSTVAAAFTSLAGVLDWTYEIRRTQDDQLMARGTVYDWSKLERGDIDVVTLLGMTVEDTS